MLTPGMSAIQWLFLSGMNSTFKLIVCLLALSLSVAGQKKPAEKNDTNLVQFSGMVLDQDSITPIPYVSVLIKGTRRGAVTDFYGFFSMVIRPGDELEFYSITHKPRTFRTDSLKQKYYYAIQFLTKDTVQLPSVEVFPWPSNEDFKRAFLALDLTDGDADRADRNLQRESLTYLERNQTASASENYKYVMQAYYTKLYTTGQQPSIHLLNPVRWAEFIEAWRKGKFSSNYNKKK
jgi:hypothetical protein